MAPSFIPNQNFFENYAEAILITTEDDTPLLVNRAFINLTSFNHGDIDLANPSVLLKYDAEKATGKGRWKTELIKKDGTSLRVKVSISKIILTDQSSGKVYTLTDYSTETKEVIRAREDLEQLLYVVSHDLNEPLRTVTAYIQLIQKNIEKGTTKDLNEFMNFVLDGTQRMQSMIQDLVQLSRINKETVPLSEVDLSEVIKISVAQLNSKIKELDAKVIYDDLPKLKGDTSQLIRLFTHLIDNALKFKAPSRKPEIKISVEKREPGYLFSVTDNGIGIDKEFYERIFIIFQRLHSRGEYGGTGIGLALCKKIVERHGGEIRVESEAGKGSTFYFTIKI